VQVRVSANVGDNLLRVAEQCGAMAVTDVSATYHFPFFPILIFTLLPSNQWPYMVFLFSEYEVTATQMCKPVMWLINLVMLHTMFYFYSPDSTSEPDSSNCAGIFTQDFCFEGSCCHCEMEVNGGAAEVNPLLHNSPTLHLHCTYIENGKVNFLLHPL
jgi:hypothetical protein